MRLTIFGNETKCFDGEARLKEILDNCQDKTGRIRVLGINGNWFSAEYFDDSFNVYTAHRKVIIKSAVYVRLDEDVTESFRLEMENDYDPFLAEPYIIFFEEQGEK